MLTPLGIFLRKLRLDHNEILKDMANKLNVSVSFLSAVENGKKKIPQNWAKEIKNMYNLSNEQIINFENAIIETQEYLEINLKNLSNIQKSIAISFARKLEEIDEKNMTKLLEFLKESE